MKKRLVFVALIFCLILSACHSGKKNDIAATTLPVYEFTSRITEGTDLEVARIVTENVSCLHDYSLQVRQMRILEESDICIISGAGLEDFLNDALRITPEIIDSSKDIELLKGGEHEHNHEGHEHIHAHEHHHENDPHIWLSPLKAIEMSKNIANSLIIEYPKYETIFNENLEGLIKDLEDLYNYGIENLKDLSSREIITFHDGFAYFADCFDLTILRAVEEEAGSEASAAAIIDLIEEVNYHHIPAVFVEKNGGDAAAKIIASETGVKLYMLDMAMSADSYFDAMYYNIDTIKEALR